MNAKGNLRASAAAPKAQKYWDWRAAANFIGGGSGGSLVFFAAWVSLGGAAFAPLALVGLGLVAAGLFCVWLEIGRPWRALNVFRHPSTSWMTREAAVAPFLFVFGLLALSFGGPLLTAICAALGLAFVYAQARILAADKGIPAWRHRRCLPLMVSTGVCEGAGLLAALSPWLAPAAASWLAPLLLGLLLLRALAWRAYLAGLAADAAPAASLHVLWGLDRRFLMLGHALPALLLFVAFGAFPGTLAAAGTLAVAAGWVLKYTLVRKAAYSQGFALPRQPVRGRARVVAA